MASLPAQPSARKTLPFRSPVAAKTDRQNITEQLYQAKRDNIVDPLLDSLSEISQKEGLTVNQQRALQVAINLIRLSTTDAIDAVRLTDRQNITEQLYQAKRDDIVDPLLDSLTEISQKKGLTADQQRALQVAINLIRLSTTDAIDAVRLTDRFSPCSSSR